MRTDWMKIAVEYNGAEEQKERIQGIISRMDWLRVPGPGEPPLEMAMMPGMGIKSAIKELRIPHVSHVASTNELAPFGFYGIRAHYKQDGEIDIFIIDEGSHLLTCCAQIKNTEPVEV